MSNTAGNYDDIIHHERPHIVTHPHLSIEQRAAQFAPFKTITQYHDSTGDIEQQSDIPDTELILDEDYIDPEPETQISPED